MLTISMMRSVLIVLYFQLALNYGIFMFYLHMDELKLRPSNEARICPCINTVAETDLEPE